SMVLFCGFARSARERTLPPGSRSSTTPWSLIVWRTVPLGKTSTVPGIGARSPLFDGSFGSGRNSAPVPSGLRTIPPPFGQRTIAAPLDKVSILVPPQVVSIVQSGRSSMLLPALKRIALHGLFPAYETPRRLLVAGRRLQGRHGAVADRPLNLDLERRHFFLIFLRSAQGR